MRNQAEQRIGYRVSGGRNTGPADGRRRRAGVRKHIARQGQSLTMPQSFIGEKEKRLVLVNRATKIAAKLIALKRRHRQRSPGRAQAIVECIAGIEEVVSNVIVELAVEFVGAGAAGNIDDRPRIAPVFRAVGGIIHLEFSYRVDGRLEGDLVLHHVIQVDAVDHPVDRILAVPGRIHGKRALAAQGGGQEAILRRCYATWYQQRQINKVTAIERNFLYCTLIDGLADRHGGALNNRRCSFYGDHLGRAGDLEPEVLHNVLADLDGYVFGLFGLESALLDLYLIDSGRQGRDLIVAGAAGCGGALEPFCRIRHRYLRADNGCAGSISDGAFDTGGGLSECDRCKQQSEHGQEKSYLLRHLSLLGGLK